MFKSLGVPEIILILVIVLIFFGVGKLPQVGGAIGKAIRNFRKGQTGEDLIEEEEEENIKAPIKSSKAKTNSSQKTASKKA